MSAAIELPTQMTSGPAASGPVGLGPVGLGQPHGLEKQARDTWSQYFRARRFALIAEKIRVIAAAKGQCRIIDVGGREEYWRPIAQVLAETKAHVTVVNLEQTQPEPAQHFSFAYGDACNLSDYESQSFDFVHSNSLIEHVGDESNMARCAAEIRRLATAYYVQTPYLWFPIEPHFRTLGFAWLPITVRARLLQRFDLGYMARQPNYRDALSEVEGIRLLDKRCMRALFPDAVVTFERVAGLPKSMLAVRD